MINQMPLRVWSGVLAMLTPAFLIDRLLDWMETLGGAIQPAQGVRLPREEVPFDGPLD